MVVFFVCIDHLLIWIIPESDHDVHARRVGAAVSEPDPGLVAGSIAIGASRLKNGRELGEGHVWAFHGEPWIIFSSWEGSG
jgi:hypothetical protein